MYIHIINSIDNDIIIIFLVSERKNKIVFRTNKLLIIQLKNITLSGHITQAQIFYKIIV